MMRVATQPSEQHLLHWNTKALFQPTKHCPIADFPFIQSAKIKEDVIKRLFPLLGEISDDHRLPGFFTAADLNASPSRNLTRKEMPNSWQSPTQQSGGTEVSDGNAILVDKRDDDLCMAPPAVIVPTAFMMFIAESLPFGQVELFVSRHVHSKDRRCKKNKIKTQSCLKIWCYKPIIHHTMHS